MQLNENPMFPKIPESSLSLSLSLNSKLTGTQRNSIIK